MNQELKRRPTYDLDRVFLPYQEGAECDTISLPEAVQAVAESGREPRAQFVLFDPAVARVSRLYVGESLLSWLLRASGLVTDELMIELIESSRSCRSSTAYLDILVERGKASHSDIRAAMHAEALVKEGLIYRGFAASALKYSLSNFVTFVDALGELGLHPDRPFEDNRLVRLLLKVDAISPQALMKARKDALSKGITIGWSLIKNGLISEQLLKVLIESLIAFDAGNTTSSQLVTAVVRSMRASADDPSISPEARLVSELNIATADRAFGNLLLASGSIKLEEILYCSEVAIEESCPLDVVIAEFQLVDTTVIQGARELTELLLSKAISARKCMVLLERLRQTGKPINEIMDGNITVPTTDIMIQGNLAVVGGS